MASGVKLTKRVVDAARPAQVDVMIWDSEVIGFGLRIKPSGVRSFVFRYRPPSGGNDRKVTIGRYPALSVEEARDGARELYVQRTRGADPAAERRQAREGMTLAELADYYLGPHALLKGNRKTTITEYRRSLNTRVLPAFGKRKLDHVSKAELAELIQSMSSTPVGANRLRAVLSGMFRLALNMGWVTDNPCRGLASYRERPRQRFLSPPEQGRLMGYLAAHRDQRSADVVRLLMLTGARRGEVLGATWDMFDLSRAVWQKPSHHTKQGREHVVSLPGPAVELLKRRRLTSTSDYVFPRRGDPARPMVGIKKFWTKLQHDLSMHELRIHDLRHTTASVLISSGHSIAEVGGMLGHTQSRTTERYAHLFDENMRRAAATLGRAFESANS